MTPRRLVMGTRGSPLALAQSGLFADDLRRANPGLEIDVKKITTSGDRIQTRFLSEVGGKGLFVKEIEDALFAAEIDFAVHSLKDMPAVLPQGLEIGCYPERRSPRDVLVSQGGLAYQDLPKGAYVGTSSLRRRLQLAHLRPDFRFEMLRGNIDTRMRRLEEGAFDAIVLAKAGMERLGLDMKNAVEIPILPAPGQGTLAIEIRSEDVAMKECLAPLHHPGTGSVSLAERHVMRELGGSCNLPLGVFGEIQGDQMKLSVFLASPEGGRVLEASRDGSAEDPLRIAEELVAEVWRRGGLKILQAIQQI